MNPAVDFDKQLVLYSQRTFRQILDCMARPGKVNSFEPIPASGSGFEADVSPYLLGLGYALLDVEVGFYVFQQEQSRTGLAAALEFQTNSQVCSLAEADFIFMTSADEPESLANVKCGNLDYPDNGATVIIRIDYLSEERLPETIVGVRLELKGPGISGKKALFVTGLTERHVRVLRDINVEFPVGIDLVLVCGGRLACIPRSVELNVRRN
jgi:alpha-D-ribose 1-methylphosphonate 5-triphosphate synthase subunit PhnH